jgi:hypothetical protein
VLGFGFGLVENGNWGYGHFFVQFSLAAWGASALLGMFFLGPESAKLGKLLPARAPADRRFSTGSAGSCSWPGSTCCSCSRSCS